MSIKHQWILRSLYQDFENERRFIKRYKDVAIKSCELSRYQRSDLNAILKNIGLIMTKIEILQSSFPADVESSPFDVPDDEIDGTCLF